MHGYLNTPRRDACLPNTGRGTVCRVTTNDSLTPPPMTSSNPPKWPVDRVFPSAQLIRNLVLEEDRETSLAREIADFPVTPWPLALATELVGPLALYLIIYHTFQLLFPVFAFLSCKPGLHLSPGAWSYRWLFWNADCPLPALQSPPGHCAPAACPSSTSQTLCQFQILFAMVLHFLKATDQIIKWHRVQWK